MKSDKKTARPTPSANYATTHAELLLHEAMQLVEAGELEQALKRLTKESSCSPDVLNARGVCLLRLGRTADAIRVLRSFVLAPGCTCMRPELPVIYRANFATSLLLGGLALGVRYTLAEFAEKDHPSVVRLRDAMRRWEQGLSWWQRLGWRCGLAPAVPIAIDFVPGEFVDPRATPVGAPPSPKAPQPAALRQAA
ncbi:MAG: hypothetical protein KDB14_10310 [Planctomycetales bacterium]|nr:hypothetical protein [Planctomycetales bacterium]